MKCAGFFSTGPWTPLKSGEPGSRRGGRAGMLADAQRPQGMGARVVSCRSRAVPRESSEREQAQHSALRPRAPRDGRASERGGAVVNSPGGPVRHPAKERGPREQHRAACAAGCHGPAGPPARPVWGDTARTSLPAGRSRSEAALLRLLRGVRRGGVAASLFAGVGRAPANVWPPARLARSLHATSDVDCCSGARRGSEKECRL